MTAPGWYPDPSGNGGQRYWDGINWSTAVPPKRNNTGLIVAICVGVPLLLMGGCMAVGAVMSIGHDSHKSAPSSTVTVTRQPPSWGKSAADGIGSIDGIPNSKRAELIVGALAKQGWSIGTADDVLMIGLATCVSLREGETPGTVTAGIQEVHPQLGSEGASFLYGALTYAYCPEFNPLR
jgi:hypothetical protein